VGCDKGKPEGTLASSIGNRASSWRENRNLLFRGWFGYRADGLARRDDVQTFGLWKAGPALIAAAAAS
jgi:hypothetical protein